jgi:hypothetical protein
MRHIGMALMMVTLIGLFKVMAYFGPVYAAGVLTGALIVHIGYRVAHGHWIEF